MQCKASGNLGFLLISDTFLKFQILRANLKELIKKK